MLTALAASRDRQRQLVADAGHELRTPAHLAAHQPRPAHPGRRRRGGALARGPRRAARRRPRPDRGADHPDRRPRRARPRRAADPRRRAGRPRRGGRPGRRPGTPPRARPRLRRRRPTPGGWSASRSALERAVTNLLDNAAKWSPAGGTVTVRLTDGVLTVDDQGPGIADEDLPARLRPVLPGRGVPLDARLRPRPVDRAPGRRAARRTVRSASPVGRLPVHRPAPRAPAPPEGSP